MENVNKSINDYNTVIHNISEYKINTIDTKPIINEITNLTCNIDISKIFRDSGLNALTNIPIIDPCKNIIESNVNTTLQPIKNSINKIVSDLNTNIRNINNIITPVGIQAIPIIASSDVINNLSLSCPIDLSSEFRKAGIDNLLNIPSKDYCKDVIEKNINDTIRPINSLITEILNNVNLSIREVNSSINEISNISVVPINIPQINLINNLSCSIDVVKMLKDIGLDKIDILKEIEINSNIAINKINNGLDIAQAQLDESIKLFNQMIKKTIIDLYNSLTEIISSLKKQLESMNVFKDIIPKITELQIDLSKLSIKKLLETYIYPWITSYILPYIKAYLPAAQVVDIFFILVIMAIIPYLNTILTISRFIFYTIYSIIKLILTLIL
jgi:hypothetical protein